MTSTPPPQATESGDGSTDSNCSHIKPLAESFLMSMTSDILENVISFLPIRDVATLALLCRSLNSLASKALFHTFVLDGTIIQRIQEGTQLPPARCLGLVRNLIISEDWRFDGDEEDDGRAEGDEEEAGEEGTSFRFLDDCEREAFRICSEFLRACTNLTSLQFNYGSNEHPLRKGWYCDPELNFASMLAPTITRIRSPPGMPLRCLRDLVASCPQLERINVGFQDDFFVVHEQEMVGLRNVLELLPNLKEVDIEYVSDLLELEDVLERLGELRCVRMHYGQLLLPPEDEMSEENPDCTDLKLHELVAQLARKTMVQIVDEDMQLYGDGFEMDLDFLNLPWVRSPEFLAILPELIAQPVSSLNLRAIDRFKLSRFANPEFAFLRTALDLTIESAVDGVATVFLRLGFPNLQQLVILPDKSSNGFPRLLMEVFSGRYPKLESFVLEGSIICANDGEGQYEAFWKGIKTGVIPPPSANIQFLWLPLPPDSAAASDLCSWMNRGKVTKLTYMEISLPRCTRKGPDVTPELVVAMKRIQGLVPLVKRNPLLKRIHLYWSGVMEWVALRPWGDIQFTYRQAYEMTSSSLSEEPPALHCELMDGFAIYVQIVLGCIALSSLIVKRSREHPKRPVVIWAFDTSKQAIAASMVHFTNVFLSYISGKSADGSDTTNPCVWYFLNILLDTTVGVGILYMFLRILHFIAEHIGIRDIRSGEYGNPPSLYSWFKQLLIFLTAWFFVKLSVVLSLEIFPFFVSFAEIILAPLTWTGDTRLQVVVVMLIFPLIMNICQAWLIDMVIKAKPELYHKYEGGEEGEEEPVFDEEEYAADLEASGGSGVGPLGLGRGSRDGAGGNGFLGSPLRAKRKFQLSNPLLDLLNPNKGGASGSAGPGHGRTSTSSSAGTGKGQYQPIGDDNSLETDDLG
ncbi:hypothetical protein HK102_005512 [Quaeritorhiza haematococci]|nr:hypothetical protein HK102_005512 [Quaeritorhiza haematococci]